MNSFWQAYLRLNIWLRVLVAAVVVVVLLVIIGSFIPGEEDDEAAVAPTPTGEAAALVRDQPTATPAPTASPEPAAPPTPSPAPTPSPPPTPSPAPTPPPLTSTAPLQPGAQIKVGGVVITVNGIVDPFVSPNQFLAPDAGARFVALDVTLTNDADRPYGYNTLLDWKVQTTDARVYNADLEASSATNPFLSAGNLQAKGDQARGWVAFAIPQEQPIREVRFQSITSTNQGKFEVR